MFRLVVDDQFIPLLPREKNTNGNAPLGFVTTLSATDSFGTINLYTHQSGELTITVMECRIVKACTLRLKNTIAPSQMHMAIAGYVTFLSDLQKKNFLGEGQFCLRNDPDQTWNLPSEAGDSYVLCTVHLPIAFLRQHLPAYLGLTRLFAHAACGTPFTYPSLPCTPSMMNDSEKIRYSMSSGLGRLPSYLLEIGNTLPLRGFSQLSHHLVGTLQFADPRVQEAAGIINLHPEAHYSIAALSQAVHTNEFSLKRSFRESLHISIFEYIRERRLELAVRLLLDQGLNEEIVANLSGYSGSDALIRAFKREFGGTPGHIRLAGK